MDKICPIIKGLMMVRLDAADSDHPAIDAAIGEIRRLRAILDDEQEGRRILEEVRREELLP